jgi:hypothetical protein
MHAKLTQIEEQCELASIVTTQQQHDKWDTKLGEFMKHSEKVCT